MPDIENSTNQLLRKKYFIDADAVINKKREAELPDSKRSCRVYRAEQVKLAETVRIWGERGVAPTEDNQIQVQVVRDGDQIVEIKINCPCGRHAVLDCQYEG